MNEYALYKGEDLLMIGTVSEIAEERGILKSTVLFYQTQSYKNRSKNGRNRLELVKID